MYIPPTQPPSGGSGEVKNANGHSIGVNDGSFTSFDVGRRDQALKQQAADALKGGNSTAALSLWHQALTINSNDAFQGVSGQVSFGSDGNPINKTLVILFVPSNGQIQQVAVCSINTGCQ